MTAEIYRHPNAPAAHYATHQIGLEPGQKLLILGAVGGVGLMAAQIGRVREFTVIGIASEYKRTVVESTGAAFIMTTSPPGSTTKPPKGRSHLRPRRR